MVGFLIAVTYYTFFSGTVRVAKTHSVKYISKYSVTLYQIPVYSTNSAVNLHPQGLGCPPSYSLCGI